MTFTEIIIKINQEEFEWAFKKFEFFKSVGACPRKLNGEWLNTVRRWLGAQQGTYVPPNDKEIRHSLTH